MSALPEASVIVRAKDKAATIGATLEGLLSQTVRPQIIVVDSGSTDGTLRLAAQYADEVVHVPAETFNFGHSLNVGAARATAPVHFALSAHSVPPHDRWVEGHLRHYQDPRVGAVCGESWLPGGHTALTGVYRQLRNDMSHQMRWGFSNTASSWRAKVWEELPFREDLTASEDKEWSWRVLEREWEIVYDRSLLLPLTHRRGQGLRRNWERIRKEAAAAMELGVETYPSLQAVTRAWWTDFSFSSGRPPWQRRLSPHRAVEHFGTWSGEQSVRRNRQKAGAAT